MLIHTCGTFKVTSIFSYAGLIVYLHNESVVFSDLLHQNKCIVHYT